MLLAEKFLLLLIDKETSVMKTPMFFRYAYTGAVIIELLSLNKITLEKKMFKVVVLPQDNTPTGERPLDYLLSDISNSKNKSLGSWLRKYCNNPDFNLIELLFQSMKNKGILQDIKEESQMGIFKKMTYPLVDPKIKMALQEEIREGIMTEDQPTETALALLSLMYGTWSIKKLIRKEDRKKAQRKMKKLFAKGERSLIKEYSVSIYYVAKGIRNVISNAIF